MNILNFLGCWGFFRKISFGYTNGTDKFNVEIFAENDVVFQAWFDLEVLMSFLTDVTQLKHTICDFFVEEGDLLLNAAPNAALPFGVVLFLLLEMGHEMGF